MDEHACVLRIAADLKQLGILAGNSILLHSSLKSLGAVAGGIESVIQGIMGAIGTEGSLLMPALNWTIRPPQCFNVNLTPGIVGVIPEYFRTRNGTQRSIHPTHSVCAIGPRTQELLSEHGLDNTPCGQHSPFHKLLETEGKIVMLGCGLEPNTSMHAIEEYVQPAYLYGQNCVYTIIDQQRKHYQKEYRTHGFDGYRQRYDRVMSLDCSSFLSTGMVLQATTYVLDMPKLKAAVLAKLNQDTYFFVDKEK